MKNIKRNWKTTLAGILAIFSGGVAIYNNPANLNDPQTLAAIAGGVGLILAKDGGVTGAAPRDGSGSAGH